MRKRKKLEVSTFPFLAVLLCTMGSLILLLLVMDKKAKKAALEKAYEASWTQQKKLQDKTNVEKLITESEKNAWVKLKTEQHGENLIKESALEKEIVLLKTELAQIEKNYKPISSKGNAEELPKKETAIAEEKARINILEKTLETEKSAADKNLKDTKNLSEKIVTMELILKELKASINKDKFAYSIVPYFGKNGLNRKPLYVECNEAGIILFPDKKLFPSDDETDNLKNELLNRTSQLREYLLQTLGPKDAIPYLMILVRPGGITNYWKLQTIIKPMDIDFGYELVDKIWVLDIPLEQSAPAPAKLSTMIRPIPKPIPAPGNIRGGINNGNGSIPKQNDSLVNNGIYANDKKSGSSGNSKSISYGATAQNIRPLTAVPGFPGSNGATKNNPTIVNNANGSGLGNNNPNGSGKGNNNPNGSGLGNNNLNGSSLKNNNPNGSGLGNNNPNKSGLGNNNPNGSGLGNSNPNKSGLGNNNPNGSGLGNNNPNNSGLGNNDPKGSGLGNSNPNGTGQNNINGYGQKIAQNNNSNNGNYQKENNADSLKNINTKNPESNTNSSQKNNNGNGLSGGSTPTNMGNSGNAFDSKGSYSNSTSPNSFSEDNQNGKKGSASGSQGDEKTSTNKPNPGGITGTQNNEPNSTAGKESIQNPSLSNNQSPQPAKSNQNPNISISLNNENNQESNASTKQNPPRTTYNREDESQSNSEAQDPTARIAAPLPELGPRKSQSPTPLRAARLFADRDWVIYVECKFEEISVHPNRLVIPTNLLASDEGVKRFVQEIEKIIQRKQSTVRPGEPLYRPEVRFLVWPDGLRPYHLSYPALQLAGIKQKRLNLEPEDSIKEIIQGR